MSATAPTCGNSENASHSCTQNMREIKIAQLEIPAIMYFGPECYVLVVGLYFKADSDSILMITFFLGPFLLSRILWARLLQMSWECGSLVLQQRSMPGWVVWQWGVSL